MVDKIDLNTEEKIKQAAKKVFYRKGFEATRTRDIAEEAGINLALLNYYYRSKAKLFEIVVMETLHAFLQEIAYIFLNNESSLYDKITELSSKYIDMTMKHPYIPLFMITEINRNPDFILEKFPLSKLVIQSPFFKQFEQIAIEKKLPTTKPLHYILNLLGMLVFPIVSAPISKTINNFSDKEFEEFILERKKLIPIWISQILN